MTDDPFTSVNPAAPRDPPGVSPPPDEPSTAPEAEAILRQLAGFLLPPTAGTENPPGPEAAPGEARETTPGCGSVQSPDFGERPQAEALLRKAEARFKALVDQIPVVTFMAALDEGSNELYVSPQIEALLGFSQKEWLENPVLWYMQLHPDDRERWHREFAQTCRQGARFRSEYRFLARDGRVVWVHGECQVVRDAHGFPLFLLGVAYDISESKRAEEALRRLHAELEFLVRERTAELARANEALETEILERRRLEEALQQRAEQLAAEVGRKDHFLAILAHELRNPLAPLRNALQILRQPGSPDAVREWAKGMMDRQVRNLTRLIEDLMDVARINQGKIELRKEAVDLATILTRAVETVRPLLAERRHELVMASPPGGFDLQADPLRLEQVFVNLLNNAAKYTEPGGRIHVAAERQGGEAVVRVRDTGAGIPPEMLERIFDPFSRLDRSLASSSQWGLGIGLMLVRTLVNLHGGSVRARSAGRGQGSEFVVRLPLVVQSRPAGEGRRASSSEPTASRLPPARRVLIVDDNVDLAESLHLLLRSWGYEVDVAHDGPAALVAARAQSPEVILLDIGLPGMTGYEVARRLRQQPSVSKALIVALSGYGQDEDRRRSREAGFDHHLTKPADPEALRELVQRAAGDHAVRARSASEDSLSPR